MPGWTRVANLFSWPPFQGLTDNGRLTWLGLYITDEAKRSPPGLFRGGVAILAEAANKPAHEIIAGLGELRDHDLIERDEQRKLIRMKQLPDKGERPPNGNCLRMWWNSFRAIPQCSVRDAYVPLLEWLTHPMTEDHLKVWSATWGTVTRTVSQVPEPVPAFQGSLFISGTPETVTDTHPLTVPGTVGVEGRGDQDLGIRTASYSQPVGNLSVVRAPALAAVDHDAPLTSAEREAGYELRQIPEMAGLPPTLRKVRKGHPAW